MHIFSMNCTTASNHVSFQSVPQFYFNAVSLPFCLWSIKYILEAKQSRLNSSGPNYTLQGCRTVNQLLQRWHHQGLWAQGKSYYKLRDVKLVSATDLLSHDSVPNPPGPNPKSLISPAPGSTYVTTGLCPESTLSCAGDSLLITIVTLLNSTSIRRLPAISPEGWVTSYLMQVTKSAFISDRKWCYR